MDSISRSVPICFYVFLDERRRGALLTSIGMSLSALDDSRSTALEE